MMPNLHSEFEPLKDDVGTLFATSQEAIRYLYDSMRDISTGAVRPQDARRYAQETLRGLRMILPPVDKKGIEGPR
ncbi:MAG: hypothetical protein KGI37_11215 [Alphaproteobacteria bacterium]|nr:hypothetical protein [Alphaproteobacteria bacterium]